MCTEPSFYRSYICSFIFNWLLLISSQHELWNHAFQFASISVSVVAQDGTDAWIDRFVGSFMYCFPIVASHR